MAIPQGDQDLRLITICSFVPAFAMLLPYGIMTRQVVPSLGLVPMAISAVFGLAQLSRKANHRAFTVIMDAFISVFLLSVTIPGIVFIRNGYGRWYDPGLIMFGTYATCPLLLVLCVHVWFVLRELRLTSFFGRMFMSRTCSHCQKDLSLRWDMRPHGSSAHSSDSKGSYVQVNAECAENDGETVPSGSETPRPSTDDETVRLV